MARIDVLSIGNSFSEDAQRYLHSLAKHEGDEIQSVNLYIGGCPLDRHFRNMMGDEKAYDLHINGQTGLGFKMSIKEALLARNWTYITLQQSSPLSYKSESYFPYIERLAKYVREYAPGAKLLIHQTWAYENGSELIARHGFESYDQMFELIEKSYRTAANKINADGILRSGEAVGIALRNGISRAHRDGFHLGLGAGRFIAALVWYKYMTGKDISAVSFSGFDVPVTPEDYKIAIDSVNELKI